MHVCKKQRAPAVVSSMIASSEERGLQRCKTRTFLQEHTAPGRWCRLCRARSLRGASLRSIRSYRADLLVSIRGSISTAFWLLGFFFRYRVQNDKRSRKPFFYLCRGHIRHTSSDGCAHQTKKCL